MNGMHVALAEGRKVYHSFQLEGKEQRRQASAVEGSRKEGAHGNDPSASLRQEGREAVQWQEKGRWAPPPRADAALQRAVSCVPCAAHGTVCSPSLGLNSAGISRCQRAQWAGYLAWLWAGRGPAACRMPTIQLRGGGQWLSVLTAGRPTHTQPWAEKSAKQLTTAVQQSAAVLACYRPLATVLHMAVRCSAGVGGALVASRLPSCPSLHNAIAAGSAQAAQPSNAPR